MLHVFVHVCARVDVYMYVCVPMCVCVCMHVCIPLCTVGGELGRGLE